MPYYGKEVRCGKSWLKIRPIVSCFKMQTCWVFLFITVEVTIQPLLKKSAVGRPMNPHCVGLVVYGMKLFRNEFFPPVIIVPNSKFYYRNYLVLKKQWNLKTGFLYCRYTYYRLEYQKTPHQISLYFSLQCRRFLRVRKCFCSRKRHVETPRREEKIRRVKGCREREEKITFAQSKHRTLQSIIYSPEKQKTYWNKQHFGMR